MIQSNTQRKRSWGLCSLCQITLFYICNWHCQWHSLKFCTNQSMRGFLSIIDAVCDLSQNFLTVTAHLSCSQRGNLPKPLFQCMMYNTASTRHCSHRDAQPYPDPFTHHACTAVSMQLNLALHTQLLVAGIRMVLQVSFVVQCQHHGSQYFTKQHMLQCSLAV